MSLLLVVAAVATALPLPEPTVPLVVAAVDDVVAGVSVVVFSL